jgi:MYXO-CTERM domain-containing protein
VAVPAPASAAAGVAAGASVAAVGNVTVPAPGQSAGIPAGLGQLPSSATSAGLGALALLALGALAAFRRRMR